MIAVKNSKKILSLLLTVMMLFGMAPSLVAAPGDEADRTTIVDGVDALIDIPVSITWDDRDNELGRRPDEVLVRLLQNDVLLRDAKISAGDNWSYAFAGLPLYSPDGTEYCYSVKEEVVEGYSTHYIGVYDQHITNTLDNTMITIDVEKSWAGDINNIYGTRPDAVTYVLKQDGRVFRTQSANAPTYGTSFTRLPRYASDGSRHVYKVEEQPVKGYKAAYSGVYDEIIKNTIDAPIALIDIPVRNVWSSDSMDRFGTRPDMVTYILKRDGVECDRATASAPAFGHVFANQPRYKDDGSVYVYLVSQEQVSGYVTTYSGVFNETVVNKLNEDDALIDIPVTKIWEEDEDNRFQTRPASITYKLTRNGDDYLSGAAKAPQYRYTFSNLPKYDGGGDEITYEVMEQPVDGYTTSYRGAYNQIVTNTRVEDPDRLIDIPVSKRWIDNENVFDTRPESIVIELWRNDYDAIYMSQTLTAADNWQGSFSDLPQYNHDGAEIEYLIKEQAVSWYIPGYEGAYSQIVTNTLDIEFPPIDIAVEKIWDDNENASGKRPDTVTFVLKRDREEIDRKIASAPNFDCVFPFMDKYDLQTGREYIYEVMELPVEGYTTSYEGAYNQIVTNTLIDVPVPFMDITVAVDWEDFGNVYDARPESIVVELWRNDKDEPYMTQKMTGESRWQYIFRGLPESDNRGEAYVYLVKLQPVDGYETSYAGDYNEIITNTLIDVPILFMDVTVIVDWEDFGNFYDARPESIVVELWRNDKDEPYMTQILTGESRWQYIFRELPEGDNRGAEYAYLVKLQPVEGYTTSYEGAYNQIVTNTISDDMVGQTILVAVAVFWEDEDDEYGLRPESIEVELWRDGDDEPYMTQALIGDDNWQHFFSLPRRDDSGLEYVYSIKEQAASGYTPVYYEDYLKEGFMYAILNRLDRLYPPIDIPVTKIWNDEENAFGTRPDTVTFDLMRDGEVLTSGVAEAPDYEYTFSHLPKHDFLGEEYDYEIVERTVNGYLASYNGEYNQTVTNTLMEDPITSIDILVDVLWVGSFYGADPESIVVELWQNDSDEPYRTKVLTSDDEWNYTFVGLPFRSDSGEEYVYHVKQQPIVGFTTSYSGANDEIITNTVDDDVYDILTYAVARVIWTDEESAYGLRPESVVVELWRNDGDEPYMIQTLATDMDREYLFRTLPKCDDSGDAYVYSIKQQPVNGYSTSYSESSLIGGVYHRIYNTLINDTERFFDITVMKIWDDDSDADGVRPESIAVDLWRNDYDAPYMMQSFTADNYWENADQWQYTFEGLPMRDENGEAYEYLIKEQPVDGYIASYEGAYNEIITNTMVRESEEFTGSLIVCLRLFDVNGALVDDEHPDYDLHNEPFTIRVKDASDPDKAPLVTELSVRKEEEIVFPIRNIDNVAGVSVELANDLIPSGYQYYDTIPVYWDEFGQGVTTILGKVSGKGILPGEDGYIVHFYITSRGRLYKSQSMVDGDSYEVRIKVGDDDEPIVAYTDDAPAPESPDADDLELELEPVMPEGIVPEDEKYIVLDES